ncbi:MAG: hypothetical protein NVSMB51_07330 [Solirubrobacteraceae bacterium]
MSIHPIRLTNVDDGARSRLTTFFRLLLAIPHLLWLELWGIAAVLALLVSWFATLFTGQTPDPLHNFLAAFERYRIHVTAFLCLIANPFPGFTGAEGSYPVDLRIDGPAPQNRWKTFLRLPLAFPALLLVGVAGYALYVVALLAWWAALVTGRMPEGMQRLGAYALRYVAQVNGYVLLLTDRYPYSGPEREWIESGSPRAPAAAAAGPAAPPAFRDG